MLQEYLNYVLYLVLNNLNTTQQNVYLNLQSL